jgi:hypothetical protein
VSSIAAEFADVLGTVSRPNAFCVAGTEQILAPGLAVEGVGSIALPLLPVQAEQLIAIAERAPYGRGEDTLTDVTVRRTWQIAPDRVRIAGKHWPQTIQAVVARVAEGLGVADPVEAELYKLLVYDTGSFFVPHRDTEKVPGLFATIVLALPSVSTGGDLIARHRGREMRLELRCEEPSDIAFAAFYADCVHEVQPVTAGYRLVLVYNLVRRGGGRLPGVPDYTDEQAALTTLLRQWVEAPRPEAPEPEDADPDDDEDQPDDAEPEKLIYLLAHAVAADDVRRARARRTAFSRGDRQRRRIVRAHLSSRRADPVAARQAAGGHQPGRAGRHHAVPGRPARSLDRRRRWGHARPGAGIVT